MHVVEVVAKPVECAGSGFRVGGEGGEFMQLVGGEILAMRGGRAAQGFRDSAWRGVEWGVTLFSTAQPTAASTSTFHVTP